MKRLLVISTILLAAACSKYNSEMEYQRQLIADMETAVFNLNTSIEGLSTVVNQLQQNDYVSDIIEIKEDGVLIGYTIVFSKGEKATLYFGQKGPSGQDGIDGEDGVTPVIGVKQYIDGLWYWTLNGEWLRGTDGKRIQVTGSDGATPMFKLISNNWYISYDGGDHWTLLGSQIASSGVIIKKVDTAEDNVKITLADGTVLTLQRGSNISIWMNSSSYYYYYGETKLVTVSYTQGADVLWSIEGGWSIKTISRNSNTATLEITAPQELSDANLLLIASLDGGTCTSQYTLHTITSDLSANGLANCYIINKPGRYIINTAYKGNSSQKIEDYWFDCEWYGSGTSDPFVSWGISNTYINNVQYLAVTIYEPMREGNFLISARNNDGVLWSWHLWLTDYNPEVEYETYKGHEDIPVMTRNLGSTSKDTKGMLYQWGRKDPFPYNWSYYSVRSQESVVASDYLTGSMEYASAHPTCFITPNSLNGDWYYTGEDYSYDKRWSAEKTMYDPCPPGWKVPVGGSEGLWSEFPDSTGIDGSKQALVISDAFSTPAASYVMVGHKDESTGKIMSDTSGVWSSTHFGSGAAFCLSFNTKGNMDKQYVSSRARALSVRCCKETGRQEDPETDYDLSSKGTSNCYLVQKAGDYSFRADVCGNGEEAIEGGKSATVLWESFGTDKRPNPGDLVNNVKFSEGRIYFSTPSKFKSGNAVIALKDNYGQILWSWHIWICDFNPDKSAKYVRGLQFMDRNLGATSATPGETGAIGLNYQFGRKDPFLGSSSIYEFIIASSTNSYNWGTDYFYDDRHSQITDTYFRRHPMTLVSAEYQRIPAENRYWKESEKTMTDPCPYGWKVGNPASYINSRIWNSYLRGYLCDSDLWFPVSGEGIEFNFCANLWRIDENAMTSYSPYVSFVPSGSAYWFGTSGYSRQNSVRCIKFDQNKESDSEEPERHK